MSIAIRIRIKCYVNREIRKNTLNKYQIMSYKLKAHQNRAPTAQGVINSESTQQKYSMEHGLLSKMAPGMYVL